MRTDLWLIVLLYLLYLPFAVLFFIIGAAITVFVGISVLNFFHIVPWWAA